ncbi:MAG: diguanylate cyclase [Nitrospirota bacterium]|nr:diguanylate cyclase [Nitrospirota bacterium]
MPLSTWPKLFRSYKDARVFFISISFAVILVLAFISFNRYRTVNHLLVQTMRHEAESFANLIIIARHWNAAYGGVYVVKKPVDRPTPHLRDAGNEPDIRTSDGRVLTLKNPAIMTREISEITSSGDLVRFHMISMKPLNPDNKPDAFEYDALLQFERGSSSHWAIDRDRPDPLFRFIHPLKVEKPCLQCHAKQGYKEGDIRGAVSIMIPASDLLQQMRRNATQKVMDFLIAVGLLLAILYFLTWKLFVKLDEVQRRLKLLAVTDELTGLRNRRFIMEQLEKEYQRAVRAGTPLSVMILDIDHFKRVNDNYGHVFGDQVLKAVAQEMEKSLRAYDLLGRIGGEEFLIASPGSSLDDAAALAERIRDRIKGRTIANHAHKVKMTISAGVTSLGEHDGKMNSLLIRADDALYQAKQQGRDRVITL